MDSPIVIYDTTLRDGTQGEGISFSAEDKILVARRMDAFGFDYIEGGWPGSNPRDMRFFELAAQEHFTHAKLAAFGSTRRANLRVEDDQQIKQLIAAGTPVVTIFGKTWVLHVEAVLNTTREENLAMIQDSVQYLDSSGKEVIYDAEHFFDGYEDDPEYALATLQAANSGGANFIVLCDTNGGTQVNRLMQIVTEVRSNLDCPIGVHCHNDCGLGVALSVAGVEAGACMVQGTVNGYGERVGNANLTSILPNLHFKLDYKLNCSDQLSDLREFSMFVDRLANIPSNKKEPFVGASAFAHKGGVHANAARKVARSYEHMQPATVGNQQRILLSDMSGGSSVALKARKFGLELEEKSETMRHFLSRLKTLENQGYEFENADASFFVLLHHHFKGASDPFELVSYRTISEMVRDGDTNISEAVVKLRIVDNPEIRMTISESSGPVGALDQAMRKAFSAYFPALKKVNLLDYKVRILQMGMGTDSTVQVLMKSGDGVHNWWTCGADSSIIEASYQALRDSFRFYLLDGPNACNS